MKNSTKNIILVIVVALIVVTISYLESQKPHNLPGVDVPLPGIDSTATSTQNRQTILSQKASQYPRAKELAGIQGYINTPEFKLSDLVGKKVVLIDFWTYSCINCIRTIPYLNAWYQKYKDQGLVVVGVHTPEFDFEKVYENVVKGVKDLGVTYPVVLDSNYGTWDAYGNEYWPHEYLIDIDGFIVHDHIGEGDYDVTEKAIQDALKERASVLGLSTTTIDSSISNPQNVISMNGNMVESPETYFGSDRNEYLANGTQAVAGPQTLTLPSKINLNSLYLDGTWDFKSQYAENTSQSAKIVYHYSAKNLYIVASSDTGVKIKVTLDGQPLGAQAGKDVAADGTVTIKDNRLYSLVSGSDYGDHTIQIEVQDAGLDAYTFTFG